MLKSWNVYLKRWRRMFSSSSLSLLERWEFSRLWHSYTIKVIYHSFLVESQIRWLIFRGNIRLYSKLKFYKIRLISLISTIGVKSPGYCQLFLSLCQKYELNLGYLVPKIKLLYCKTYRTVKYIWTDKLLN